MGTGESFVSFNSAGKYLFFFERTYSIVALRNTQRHVGHAYWIQIHQKSFQFRYQYQYEKDINLITIDKRELRIREKEEDKWIRKYIVATWLRKLINILLRVSMITY